MKNNPENKEFIEIMLNVFTDPNYEGWDTVDKMAKDANWTIEDFLSWVKEIN